MKAAASRDRPSSAAPGGLRYLVTVGAWFLGLFGLMRLGWVERSLLTPFARIQQQVADQLTGAPSDLVYADASCSGGDPMALCAGAILAFPGARGARLRGAALGLLAITLLNVVRLGHLSLVATDRALLELLHVHIWPGILIIATAAYVFHWMNRQGRTAPPGAATGAFALSGATRRFLVLAALLVVVYFATAPFFYRNPAVDVIAGWIAVTGGGILTALGTTATVDGPLIRTTHGAFVVTQECIFTPLIPLYVAGVLTTPLTTARRSGALAATPAVFFALGVSRLLVLAVPAAVIGSYATAIHAFSQTLVALLLVATAAFRVTGPVAGARVATTRALLAVGLGLVAGSVAAPVWDALFGAAAAGLQALAGHAGHVFVDPQGAWALVPAFQLGLFTSLWAAVAGRTDWRRAALGLGLLVLGQAALTLPVGELAHHYGFDPHVGLIRGWALAAPAALVWLLRRPAPDPAGAPAPAGQVLTPF